MAYLTVPHQWLDRFGEQRFGEWSRRAPWLMGLADRQGVLDTPADWNDRVLAWSVGLVLAVGRRDRRRGMTSPRVESGDGRSTPVKPAVRVRPDDVALLVFNRDGRTWAYSHRAVWSAGQAVRAFGIGAIWDHDPGRTWWNGWPWQDHPMAWMACPSSIPGLVACQANGRIIYWQPTILGPVLLRESDGRLRWAPELEGTLDDRGRVALRGEAVPVGRWIGTEVVPVRGEGGWWRPWPEPAREVNFRDSG